MSTFGTWQPLETAPRDGTFFLVANGSEAVVGNWPEGYELGRWSCESDTKKVWHGWPILMRESLTHWRPIPPLPGQEEVYESQETGQKVTDLLGTSVPSEVQLAEIFHQFKDKDFWGIMDLPDFIEGARAVLATWGKVSDPWRDAVIEALVVDFLLDHENVLNPRKAVCDLIQWNMKLAVAKEINEPIPLEERMPGPDDLSDKGTVYQSCWFLCSRVGEPEWHLIAPMSMTRCFECGYTHWLPAHAIPVKEAP
jgi:hypothetical protein